MRASANLRSLFDSLRVDSQPLRRPWGSLGVFVESLGIDANDLGPGVLELELVNRVSGIAAVAVVRKDYGCRLGNLDRGDYQSQAFFSVNRKLDFSWAWS